MKISFPVLIVTFIVFGCSKDNNSRPQNNHKPGIEIIGKISRVKTSGNSLADARRIMIFNGLQQGAAMNISFTEIVADTFIADCKIGQAVALVFLDENNKYIGTLSSQGLSILPLCNMPAGDSSTINLSTLSLIGTSVVPSHDPFGAEININEEDLNSLKAVDGFYEYMAKNIDTDNDGVLDILSEKQILMHTELSMLGAKFGINDQPAVIPDSVLYTLRGNSWITGGPGFALPDTVSLWGPVENPYDQIDLTFVEPLNNNRGINMQFYVRESLFRAGTYTLTLGEKTHTVSFANLEDKSKVVIVTPHLTTNNEGKLISISFEYLHADYTPVNPDIFINGLMIQIVDSSLSRLYESPWIKSKYAPQDQSPLRGFDTELAFDPPLDISRLKEITVGYIDLIGNTYAMSWYSEIPCYSNPL